MMIASQHDLANLKVLCATHNAKLKRGRLGLPDADALLLSPQQTAVLLGVARSTVDRMVRDKMLPGVVWFRRGKRKGLYGVNRKKLEEWAEQAGNKGERGKRKG